MIRPEWSVKAAGAVEMREFAGRLGALARERAPWRSLAVAAATGAVLALPGSARALLYDRAEILSGDLWRVLTGHFVHAGSQHFLWDVAALLTIGMLWERVLGARYWAVFGAAAFCITAGLLVLAPGLALYCGLSGVLSGLFTAGAMASARLEKSAGRPWTALLFQGAVLACLAKIGFEAMTGSTIFASTAPAGFEPAPLAHALGALGGAMALGPFPRPRRLLPMFKSLGPPGERDGGFSQITGSPIAVGTTPVSSAARDWNGDGRADFAVVNKHSPYGFQTQNSSPTSARPVLEQGHQSCRRARIPQPSAGSISAHFTVLLVSGRCGSPRIRNQEHPRVRDPLVPRVTDKD